MSIGEAATVLVAVIAVLISAFSLVIANRSRREAERGNSLGATVDLFREYRSDQMRTDRMLLRNTLEGIEEPSGGVTDLPEPAAQAALRLCHYLDHLGVLVEHDLFPLELVTGFLGVTSVQIWEELLPYIEYERDRREKRLYLEYFESLAVRVREFDVERLRRGRLNRWERIRVGPVRADH
jgi:hypothetical protein